MPAAYLSAALAEWRGPFLDDLREFAFVDTFATALAEVRVAVQTALAEAEIACGRADAMIPRLEVLSAEHPFRERLWAQLITAYYVAERQSDALDAYRRLKTNLAENLGIDPGPTVRSLHERILRQEPLDATQTRQTTATHGVADLSPHTGTLAGPSAVAELRGKDGQRYRLEASTRIGRRPDNDIVLDDDDVSRYHAVVIDTGGSFVISDLRSTNGVLLAGRRIRGSATLADGDHIRIGGHEFTFEIRPAELRERGSEPTQEFRKNSPGSIKAGGCTLVMSENSNRPQRRIHIRTWDNCQVRNHHHEHKASKLRVAAAGLLAAVGLSLLGSLAAPVASADPWVPCSGPLHPIRHYAADVHAPRLRLHAPDPRA